MPYHFYHHAHKLLCDHGQIFFFFLFDTDLAVSLCLIALSVLHAVPRCVPSHLVHDACYTPINALSSAAVVMIGKASSR